MSASHNPDLAALDRLRELLAHLKDSPTNDPQAVYKALACQGLNADTIGSCTGALTVLCIGAKPEARAEAGIAGTPTRRVAVMQDGRCLDFGETPGDKVGEALTRRWVNERAAANDEDALKQELGNLFRLKAQLRGGQTTFSFSDLFQGHIADEGKDEPALAQTRANNYHVTMADVSARVETVMKALKRLRGEDEPTPGRLH